MPKDQILNVRIDPELKQQARKLAEQDSRTLSNWVIWLIRRELRRAQEKGH